MFKKWTSNISHDSPAPTSLCSLVTGDPSSQLSVPAKSRPEAPTPGSRFSADAARHRAVWSTVWLSLCTCSWSLRHDVCRLGRAAHTSSQLGPPSTNLGTQSSPARREGRGAGRDPPPHPGSPHMFSRTGEELRSGGHNTVATTSLEQQVSPENVPELSHPSNAKFPSGQSAQSLKGDTQTKLRERFQSLRFGKPPSGGSCDFKANMTSCRAHGARPLLKGGVPCDTVRVVEAPAGALGPSTHENTHLSGLPGGHRIKEHKHVETAASSGPSPVPVPSPQGL